MYSKELSVFHKLSAYVLLLGVFVLCLLLISTPAKAAPGINKQMNFQGRLLNAQGAAVPDGFYNIQFKIYQDGDGLTVGNTTGSPAGSLKWTESYLNTFGQGVVVKNGYMSVQLGSITAFGTSVDWNQDTLWLSMNIASTNTSCASFASCTPDGEMVPMKRLSSATYSLNTGLLGGLASTQFLQIAQGVQTDASTNTNSIYINKTGTGNLLALQSAGTDAFTINSSGNVSFGNSVNRSISVTSSGEGVSGKSLTIAAGAASSTGVGAAGGSLTLQGGNASGTGNNTGGSITIAGGNGTGTGAQGLVNIGAAAYIAATNTPCATNCTISQASVDSSGTIIVSALAGNVIVTLPAPTNTAAAGRIIYITSDSTSTDFTLNTNSGGNAVSVAMRKNATATMIWNGTAWTPGGASNATTLQATYANGTNPTTTPEIKLDATRGTIDIQDADTTIGTDILNVRGSNPTGLGTVLFGVSNTGRVTIQGTTDEASAFRVLNATGNYLFNINSTNDYVISNTIRTPGNEIDNPNFETGGSSSGGEAGWFGPAQSSIVLDAINANTGNYMLRITPNLSDIDVYAGSYYEVSPGENLYFEGKVKNSAGANGSAGVQITWYNKDKTILSFSTNYASLPGTSYVLRKINAVAPANAQYARVSATVRSAATTGLFYFDSFYMKRSTETADYTFRNSQNGTDAFRIQSAQSAQTLFTANTTNNVLKVGDSTGSDTATTLLVLDSTAIDPVTSLATNNGGLFYRSDTNSLKAVVGGTVVDICTTAVTCSGYSASAGSTIQLQGTSPGTVQTGNFNITGTGILTQLQTQDQATASTNSSNLVLRSGNATGLTSNSGNITLDVGTATGTNGTITIGRTNVATTIGGTLNVQGSNSLALGLSSAATGSILFRTSAGANTITIRAPGINPTSSYALTLPVNLGIAGDCLKDTGSGALGFSNCAAGVTVSLQNAYDNSSPATTLLADGKDYRITAQQASVSPSILFNLQCISACAGNGRFAIQNGGTDVFTIRPSGSGGGVTINTQTQIGSSIADGTQINLQLDTSNLGNDTGTCTASIGQGSMYYNSSMGSLRACINGSWGDVSNPDTLGLLTYGIVPSTGANPYDLPSLVVPGASGPCKVSWASNTSVSIEACIAYSGGRRVNVLATTLSTNIASTNNVGLTTANRWGHVCLTGTNSQPAFTSTAGQLNATSAMPAFNVSAPVLCLASVQGESVTAGRIDNIYDIRTFTSSLKEAVNTSVASDLGMIVDAGGANGAMIPAASASAKLYGVIVATDGSTSTGAPNAIVTTVGSGWVKAIAGTSGQFVKTSLTNGYGDTTISIPNNSFYYSVGNTRTTYSTGCTSAATCNGSLYVNFIVR